jgi:hypothetical protein
MFSHGVLKAKQFTMAGYRPYEPFGSYLPEKLLNQIPKKD